MDNGEKPPAVVRWPSNAARTDTVRLHMAVLLNKPNKIVKYVKRGVPVDAYNADGQPPIFCAALLGKAKSVRRLLELGANPNGRCYHEGSTAVHGASYVGCTKSLLLLLQAGGDLRLTDRYRRTPSDWANLQIDDTKRRNIRDILDGARMCAFKPTGREMLDEWENRMAKPKSYNSLCASLPRFGKAKQSSINLRTSFLPIGYGQMYFGNDTRCGAVVGLPLVNEVSDLKLEVDTVAASWICGKFSTFVPMVWVDKKTSVSVRELRKSTVEDAIPDILIQELNNFVKLHHPNILMLMAVCYVDNYDSISLVFEKIPVGSLYFVLYNQIKRLSSRVVTDLLAQVCDAVEFIHSSGYLHGFINSHSIFLLDNYRAKIGCFEYLTPINAKPEQLQQTQHPLLRSDGHLSSYRHWAAPEIITGKRPASTSSDVYSICCVMWELIYGEVPWKDCNLEALRTMLSENPYARLPLDKQVVPHLWYHLLNQGLEPEVPLRDLELSEIRDMMLLSKNRIDVGATGDGLYSKIGSSRTSLKSHGDPVIEGHDAVDAENIYQVSFFGPQTAV